MRKSPKKERAMQLALRIGSVIICVSVAVVILGLAIAYG